MKPFLQELAGTILESFPKLDSATIVFPNRRAILYFRKYLGELLTKPAFSPTLLTIEEFISLFSPLKVPDKLELIYRLHHAYYKVLNATENDPANAEPFDQFYFWGDMLLRDFDEADRHLINADHLFKDLSHQKELDSSFDFLTDEQQQFLKYFWDNFDESQSLNKRRFLHVWKKLPLVYAEYKSALRNDGLAYEGMQHRDVSEQIAYRSADVLIKNICFAGFNALTKSEEKIISHFIDREAKMFWDIDEYYVNNKSQEAGKFFREYQEHPSLKKTFTSNLPANLIRKITTGEHPSVKIFGAAQPMGQAKLMAQVLSQHLQNANPEETLVVLPDEKMLIPVLHSVSGMVEKLNVTMGFPLASTPLFNLIEILIDLQLTSKDGFFNHRQVLAVLGHPYVVAANPVSSNAKRKEILKHNWVQIPKNFLASEVELHRVIFRELSKSSQNVSKDLIEYLRSISEEIGKLTSLGNFDKEYAYQFLKFFNRIQEILTQSPMVENPEKEISAREQTKVYQRTVKSFLRLIRQLVASTKIPFSGEPLAGLQVMGVLETRNLDFKNVFILSLNEGSFPAANSKGSYIPFNIRKAYGLPTVEHQDAIYSYLFYRTLQRAENIFLFYNSETDVLGQGEMSRYLQQLLYESGLPTERKVLHNPIQPLDISPIVVLKDKVVLEDMAKLNEGNTYFKGISPSALNMYIECRLKFYFRHIAKIKEPNEVEEELDARVLGNFLHDVMEKFYRQIIDSKLDNTIEKDDFVNYEPKIDRLIDQVFIKTYRLEPDRPVAYEGQRLVVKEVVKRFVDRIMYLDKNYAPFTIEALEFGGMTYEVPISHAPYKAVLSGKIDRVDKKENILRIIDYKTGKDKLDFDTVPSLFARDGKRNKAAFQTFLYALLYSKSSGAKQQNVRLLPGLLNRMNLFDEEFSFGLTMGRAQLQDAQPFLQDFETRIQEVFNEMFNPDQPFDQTSDLENCKLCPYRQLCYR